MKKHLCIAIIVAMVALSACGKKEEVVSESNSGTEIIGTESTVSEETVSEDTAEEEASAESTEVEEEELEGSTISIGGADIDEFLADKEKEHSLGDIGYVAANRDFRSQTGYASTDTSDVLEFLDDNGSLVYDLEDEEWELGVSGYTGRWAYPTVEESDVTKDLYLYDWNDFTCKYIADADKNNHCILMCSGYDAYNLLIDGDEPLVDTEGNEVDVAVELFGTYTIDDEDVEVYSATTSASTAYYYKHNGFTIIVEFDLDNLDVSVEEAVSQVVNSVKF